MLLHYKKVDFPQELQTPTCRVCTAQVGFLSNVPGDKSDSSGPNATTVLHRMLRDPRSLQQHELQILTARNAENCAVVTFDFLHLLYTIHYILHTIYFFCSLFSITYHRWSIAQYLWHCLLSITNYFLHIVWFGSDLWVQVLSGFTSKDPCVQVPFYIFGDVWAPWPLAALVHPGWREAFRFIDSLGHAAARCTPSSFGLCKVSRKHWLLQARTCFLLRDCS